ncbi:glycoside hydrolase family 127 protein [Saccharothrix sp. BKS2]|uniref:beta-L-arabinofuranosidase domain-containing protein n=1 Tax=Saccharothrix sp. BKS2 TaxID=3064400 RepID=UPI0039EAE2DB
MLSRLPAATLQRMWGIFSSGEFGGIVEAVCDLHARTGKPEHLAPARLFDLDRLIDACAAGVDVLEGLHANQHIPILTGLVRLHEETGEQRYLTAARACPATCGRASSRCRANRCTSPWTGLGFAPFAEGTEDPTHVYFHRAEPTVAFGGRDSGVANPSRDGTTFLDEVWAAAPFRDKGRLVRHVRATADARVAAGLPAAADADAVVRTARRASYAR